MDDLIKESLAGFDAVWQRVTGRDETGDRPPERTYPPEGPLPDLIRDELCAAACTAALARMFQGSGRALLLRHAADAKRHLRRLRAEYFIATGQTGCSGGDCRTVAGKLTSLRQLFLQAVRMAGRYEQAAACTDGAELRQALDAFAADERRRAQETRSLLVELF